MHKRRDLQLLAEERAEEVRALLGHHRFSGAYYLAGYVVELAIKAILAQRFQADEIPDKRFVESIYTHNLAALSQLAGLQPQIQKETANEEFAANWEPSRTGTRKPAMR